MVPAAASLLARRMSRATVTGMAHAPARSPSKMPQYREGLQDMSSVMGGSRRLLAIAYRDNLATFARALGGQVTQSRAVNLDLARPAVAEMRRSFGQMQRHDQSQSTMMGDHTNLAVARTSAQMETYLTALDERLIALESEVNIMTPDPKKVLEHTTEILEWCARISAYHLLPADQARAVRVLA